MSGRPPRKQSWEITGLVRIETPPDAKPAFVAGCVFEDGYCTRVAPILSYCEGRSLAWLYGYAIHRGWTATITPDPPLEPQQGSLGLV
jgi:hypothetical protein